MTPPPLSGIEGQSLMRADRVRVEERQRPYVDLLDEFVIAQHRDPVALRRVRQHHAEIAEWFSDAAGLTLHVTGSSARLVREADRVSEAHGFAWAESALDYELTVWVLWFQERLAGDQFILTELTDRIAQEAAARHGGPHLDWKLAVHRRALVRTLERLEEAGFLQVFDADLDGYVQDGRGNALYGFTDVARRFVVPQAPDGPLNDSAAREALVTQGAPVIAASDPHRAALQRAYRALLLQPVFYEADDPTAFATLVTRDNRRNAERTFKERLGWDLEITQRYAALLRPAATMSRETVFPPRAPLSGIYHVVLLTLGAIRDAVESDPPTMTVDPATECIDIADWRLVDIVRSLRMRFHEVWGSTLAERPVDGLTTEVVAVLRTWGMIAGPDATQHYRLLPLAGRYRGKYAEHALAGWAERGAWGDARGAAVEGTTGWEDADADT